MDTQDTTQEATQEAADVQLKNGTSVHLVAVERDDEEAVIGTTNSGKRFVARRDVVGEPEEGFTPEPEPIPARHRYRIYLRSGGVIPVIDPSFEEAEKWYLDGEQTLAVRPEGARRREIAVDRDDVLTLLSATPEDDRAMQATAN